ncbi:MAG TPA: glycosyltransferase, partial [Methylomirabilota bacterium]|nr:glycosyltransferase [Methylomirabilota bacterium]
MDRVQRVCGAAAGTGGPQGRPDDISRRGDTGTSGAGAPTAIASACPISVLVPTYNRHDTLLKCLGALETQTVGVFEVVVVDDGSTDGTETALSGRSFRFPLRYYRQANQGPGVARNLAMEVAQGEVVLFIGDDIIADARLLEQHLVAHTRHPEPGAAILGHIDWPPWLERTAVMDYVCGAGSQQFAYHHIATEPALDFKYFYTSNISLKRRFVAAALRAGVGFDPCFRYAGFEDSEYAYRLEARGLAIHYWKAALAYHDHWMDLDSFSRREYKAGQMAVVFYRKHPQLDEVLEVGWIGDWVDAVEQLLARPAELERLTALDRHTDEVFRGLVRRIEHLLGGGEPPGDAGRPPGRDDPGLRAALHNLFGVIFDIERTRGRVEEWYAGVGDRGHVAAAKTLLGWRKKLELLSVSVREVRALRAQLVKREATANYFRATAEHFKDEAERFKGELAEILSSPSWRLVRRLQAIRLRLFPRGSQRERLYLRLRDR